MAVARGVSLSGSGASNAKSAPWGKQRRGSQILLEQIWNGADDC